MADYRVTIARSASKEIESLSIGGLNRVFPKVEALAQNPRPYGSRKLIGETSLWRIRIGDYRVIYSIDDNAGVVDVVAVRHRKDAYR